MIKQATFRRPPASQLIKLMILFELGLGTKQTYQFLCLWFRASLIYINTCPTRCNKERSIYYSASSLYMFLVSTTPIIRSTQNCNYSLRYWSYFLCSYVPPTWPSLATLVIFFVTVLCTLDDGCRWHPKHVEWTCRIIKILLGHVGQR